MIRTKRLNAFLMKENLFDQSVVGVFPKDEKYIFYIIALLNSQIASDCINIINPSTNNSANYIKKIPFILPNEKELEQIDELIKEILTEKNKINENEKKLEKIMNKIYQI